jgi:hypothetical protein
MQEESGFLAAKRLLQRKERLGVRTHYFSFKTMGNTPNFSTYLR